MVLTFSPGIKCRIPYHNTDIFQIHLLPVLPSWLLYDPTTVHNTRSRPKGEDPKMEEKKSIMIVKSDVATKQARYRLKSRVQL